MTPSQESILRTTGNYELLTDILSITFATLLLLGFFILLVIAIIKDMKDKDNEQDYLKSLTDQERLIIAKYNDNKKLKWFTKKPKKYTNNDIEDVE